MKSIKKGIIMIAVILGFVWNCSGASADTVLRYADDIADNCIITKDIPFSEVKNYQGVLTTLKLDVYEPVNDTAVNRPVIVWIHGGNMRFGMKEDYKSLCTKLAMKGFVVVPINYRVNPNTYANEETWYKTMNEAAIDIESALKWVKENAEAYGMDPNNIILGGHSAGAELVDNIYYDDYFYKEFDRTGITACIDLSGWNLFRAPEDKVTTIGNPNTKCLVIHGKEDDVSPIENAEIFAKQIGPRGVIKFLDNHNHYWDGEGELLVVKMITDFLRDNIDFNESDQAISEEGSFLKQIQINPTEYNLYLGGKETLPIKVLLPEANDKVGKVTITYNSNNNDVAKVNSDGVITAIQMGKAVINTKITLADGKSKFISTQVNVDYAYLEISKSTSSIKKGKSFTFETSSYGLDDKDTVWSTSKKSILAIDKKTGKATAKSKGVAYITAKNGTNTDTIMVVVK